MKTVTLRKKTIKNNRFTLYLDIYPPMINIETGKETRRKFLKRFIYMDKDELKKEIKINDTLGKTVSKAIWDAIPNLKKLTPSQKSHNINIMKMAERERVNLQNRLDKPEIYDDQEQEKLELSKKKEQCFVQYYEKKMKKREGSNKAVWKSSLYYLKKFTGGSVRFKDVNVEFMEELKSWLLKVKSHKQSSVNIAHNTAATYFLKYKVALNDAAKHGYIGIDVNSDVKPIKEVKVHKETLLPNEVDRLIQEPLSIDIMKKAALFSIFTGLRFCDILKLNWSEIKMVDEGNYSIYTTQQKTKNSLIIPLADHALKLLGERQDGNKLVFEGLKYSAYNNKKLKAWISSAGIDKKITFHSFRHTFCSQQVREGSDLYVVKNLAGHDAISSTQVYSHLNDTVMRNAVNSIKYDLSKMS